MNLNSTEKIILDLINEYDAQGHVLNESLMKKYSSKFDVLKNEKCKHTNIETWNHGYHSRCRECGELDV